MKFAHIRVSEYFTFAEQIFHSEAISLARRANFVEKSTHLSGRQMCAFFWRRRRDSNSWTLLQVTRFPIVRPRPTRRLLHFLLNCRRFSHQAYVLYHTCFEKSSPFFNFFKNIFTFYYSIYFLCPVLIFLRKVLKNVVGYDIMNLWSIPQITSLLRRKKWKSFSVNSKNLLLEETFSIWQSVLS